MKNRILTPCLLAIFIMTSLPAVAQMIGLRMPASRTDTSTAKPSKTDEDFAASRDACNKLLFGDNPEAPTKNALPSDAADHVLRYITCLEKLDRMGDADAFLERVVEVYAGDWPVLERVAMIYTEALPKDGITLNGGFYRWNGEIYTRNFSESFSSCITSHRRDQVRALQLMAACIPLARESAKTGDAAQQAAAAWFFIRFADFLQDDYTYADFLRKKTDITTLPPFGDYPDDEAEPFALEAMLDDDPPAALDTLPFFPVPATFEAAENDGQRARWCLAEAEKMLRDPVAATIIRAEAEYRRAMVTVLFYASESMPEHILDEELPRLKADEMLTYDDDRDVAQRIALPADYDCFRIFHELAEGSPRKFHALQQLATLYNNRRQYVQAAACLREILDTYPKTGVPTVTDNNPAVQAVIHAAAANDGGFPSDELDLETVRYMYDMLTENQGRFEVLPHDLTPEAPAFVFQYRNAKKVTFTATKVKIDRLFADIAQMHREMEEKSPFTRQQQNPAWDGNLREFENLGMMLLLDSRKTYLDAAAAVTWSENLPVAANPHTACTREIKLPVTAPGAYFVQAQVEDGNATAMLLWVSDMVLVHKQILEDGKPHNWFFVADSVTGQPVPGVRVTGMGYDEWGSTGEVTVQTSSVDLLTDEAGQCSMPGSDFGDPQWQWLLVAQKPDSAADSRVAFLGFDSLWLSPIQKRNQLNETKVFAVTDRPVYRPGQKVQFKFWANVASFRNTGKSPLAGLEFQLEIRNPAGQAERFATLKADAYGGVSGEYEIPENAKLGKYAVAAACPRNSLLNKMLGTESLNPIYGHATFLVEEYKKPEYEITIDAPTGPVLLGDKIQVAVNARYYHGEPVTRGKLKYTIKRKDYQSTWAPPAKWDWLYGPGYWRYDNELNELNELFAVGFTHGSGRDRSQIDETIDLEDYFCTVPSEQTAVFIEIDTENAKAEYPNRDFRYEIEVTLTDESRRAIDAKGEVIVTRQPFQIDAWTQQGYARAGEPMQFCASARTFQGQPVTGPGTLTVFHRTCDATGAVKETPVFTKQIETNAAGEITQPLRLTSPGQYRVAYAMPTRDGKTVENSCIRTVTGEGFMGSDMPVTGLELIPDKREYAPGDTVKLLVNTSRTGACVMLFARAQDGYAIRPTLVPVEGRSRVVELQVNRGDTPNFFIEGLMVSGGEVFTASRNICVPPVEKTLAMEIIPDKTAYLPGEKAKARIRLTAHDGKPFVGTTVVTIYDKSLEYISGGNFTPDIHAFFWRWTRSHGGSTHSSSERETRPIPYSVSGRMDSLCHLAFMTERFRTYSLGVDFDPDRLERSFGVGGSGSIIGMGGAMGFMGSGGMGGDGSGGGGMAFMGGGGAASADFERSAGGMVSGVGIPGRSREELEQMFGVGGNGGIMGDNDVNEMTLNTNALFRQLEEERQKAAEQLFAEAVIRRQFADTAFWTATLETDANGEATIELEMPENLTTWKILAWGMGDGAAVGKASAEVITRKNLIIRMQTPRFMTVGDEMMLTANVHSYLAAAKDVTILLETDDACPVAIPADTRRRVAVPAGGEVRIDWPVRATRSGECVVRMKALTDVESDAMENRFPVQPHGIPEQRVFSGILSPSTSAAAASRAVRFTIPENSHPDESELHVRFTPSLAASLLDALPYLAGYPYGCTEQTLSRFLPTVLMRKTLKELDVELEEIKYIPPNDDDTAALLARRPYRGNPVFDAEEVDKMVLAGFERLIEKQCPDGGWDWFSGSGQRSSPALTAQVVRGLHLAEQAGVKLEKSREQARGIEKGRRWLLTYQQDELTKIERNRDKVQGKKQADSDDALVYFALTEIGCTHEVYEQMEAMAGQLFTDREVLSPSARVMLAVALGGQDESEKQATLVAELASGVVLEESGAAQLIIPPDTNRRVWLGTDTETQALFLRLLCELPEETRLGVKDQQLTPMELAPGIVRRLLSQRKNATYWHSTRDTALVVEAMAKYLTMTGEMNAATTVELLLDGRVVETKEISRKDIFAPNEGFTLSGRTLTDGHTLTPGDHTLEIRTRGDAMLYYNARVAFLPVRDFIPASGEKVKLKREYFKRVKKEDEKGRVVTSRVPVVAGDVIQSGDVLDVVLTVESDGYYSYLIFQDPKPAGFEATEVRSGYTRNHWGAYVEYRDREVNFFVSSLHKGKQSVTYRLRAEQPGSVSALPARVEGMYTSDVRANSDEMKFIVVDH